MLLPFTAVFGVQLLVVLPQLVGSESTREQAVSAHEFPYQVLISEYEEYAKCGGAVVGLGFIVTSASCVLEFGGIQKFLQDAVVYGGGASLLFSIGDIVDAVIHPSYVMDPTTFDVAIVKYIPVEKGPEVNATLLNGTWTGPEECIFTSWWAESDVRPERLNWMIVSLSQCSPYDPNLLCFSDDTPPFFPSDYGSPIVCNGVLTGIIPRGGGNRAINITSDYKWINSTIEELSNIVIPTEENSSEETHLYFVQILQKLDILTHENSNSDLISDSISSWNNQIVIPLSYVMFAMVVFFFVLFFFIVLFTVVLVYYSKK